MHDRTTNAFGAPTEVGEHLWMTRDIATRRSWLANHSNTLLNKTVYRMDALQEIISTGNWSLSLPLSCRDIQLTESLLTGAGDARATDLESPRPMLRLRVPMDQQPAVRELQVTLMDNGISLSIDGVFGDQTERAVKEWQNTNGLTVDGIVGPATWASPGLDEPI